MKPLTELSEHVTHAEHCETYAHWIAEYTRRIATLQVLLAQHELARREEANDGTT